MLKNFLHHSRDYKELGQEAASKKHMLLLNTYQMIFSCICKKMNAKRKKHLSNF
jgi:hypothetical protein